MFIVHFVDFNWKNIQGENIRLNIATKKFIDEKEKFITHFAYERETFYCQSRLSLWFLLEFEDTMEPEPMMAAVLRRAFYALLCYQEREIESEKKVGIIKFK